jgi:hypothetical protein
MAGGQPPLKDKFQATFQMTLLGNAGPLALVGVTSVSDSAVPGRARHWRGHRGLPGATLRQMGLANYKSRPEEAIRLGIAACTAVDITIDVDPRLRARSTLATCCSP